MMPLPPRSNAFVGRSTERSWLTDHTAGTGLLCLRGPAGVGKTRLVHHWVTHESRQRRPVWVDCSQAHDEQGAFDCLSQSMGLAPGPADTHQAMRQMLDDAFRARRVDMVVLDHADRLGSVCSNLVASLPQMCVLVISRGEIALPGAHTLQLEPLATDQACALFEVRATQLRPTMHGAPESVKELVERLDHLPLAIELAAARMRVMTVESLLERLDRPLDVLKDVQGTFAPVLSMTESLQWAWDLLSAAEQGCLARLSVFATPFSLRDAEAVVSMEGVSTLDALDSLVSRGWLFGQTTQSADRGLTFHWLYVVRAFAQMHREQLDPEGETLRSHAHHLMHRARTLAHAVPGTRGVWALDELEALCPELSSALRAPEILGSALCADLVLCFEWLLRLRLPADQALSMASGLANDPLHDLETSQWQSLQVLTGALEWRLGRAAQASARIGPLLHELQGSLGSEAHRLMGMILTSRSDERALDLFEAGQSMALEQGDDFAVARIRERIGFYWMAHFDLVQARHCFELAMSHLREHSNPWFRDASHVGLAFVDLRMGYAQQAQGAFIRAREDWGELRVMPAAQAKFNLGCHLLDIGQPKRARQELEDALGDFRRLGMQGAQIVCARTVALSHLDLGEHELAKELLLHAIELARPLRRTHDIALSQTWLAHIELQHDRPEVARSLLEERATAILVHADPLAALAHVSMMVLAKAHLGAPQACVAHLEEMRAIVDSLSESDHHWRALGKQMHGVAKAGWLLAIWSASGGVTREALDEALEPLGLDSQMPSPQEIEALEHVALRLMTRGMISLLASFDISLEARSMLCTLRVHEGGEWFEVDGTKRVDLSSRRPLRLLLMGLVKTHLEDQHVGLSMKELLAIGWPGEVVSDSAGSNRVYTAIRYLREYGLEGIVVTSKRGYHFAPGVVIKRSP